MINRIAAPQSFTAPTRAARPAAPASAEPSPSESVTLSGSPAEEPSSGRKALAYTAAAFAGPLAGLFGYLGGVLYAGSVIAPIAVGICKSGEEPGSLEELAWRSAQPAGAEVLMGTGSMLGSIGKEFLAPVTWAFEAGKAGFEETYGLIAG